jgi:hypothetical protein
MHSKFSRNNFENYSGINGINLVEITARFYGEKIRKFFNLFQLILEII